jgi:hypothetical protein
MADPVAPIEGGILEVYCDDCKSVLDLPLAERFSLASPAFDEE